MQRRAIPNSLYDMAALESKDAENGDLEAPRVEGLMKFETGQPHQPSEQTISAAEALKVEGNELLKGEQ